MEVLNIIYYLISIGFYAGIIIWIRRLNDERKH